MDNIEQLIADWIQVRTILKRQMRHFAEGNKISLPDRDSDRLTSEATDRLHRCVSEVEILISQYSSRG